MKKHPFISIVICTQNRSKSLKKYLFPSIEKLDYKNYEVVIVDDASKDNTLETIQSYKNKIKCLKIVKNKKSKGLCYARNLGIKHSKGDILAFTDDDCYVDKNWLKELVKGYDKNIAGVGGKIYFRDSQKIMNIKKEIFGCNMSFKKEIFDKFQFDVNMNKSHKYDEIEFIGSLRDHNLKVISLNNATVRHFEQPAAYREKSLIGGPLNLIYLHAKNLRLKFYYNLVVWYLLVMFFKKKQPYDHHIIHGKISRMKIKYGTGYEIVKGLTQIRKVYKRNMGNFLKTPWIFYVLLFEIPLKKIIK